MLVCLNHPKELCIWEVHQAATDADLSKYAPVNLEYSALQDALLTLSSSLCQGLRLCMRSPRLNFEAYVGKVGMA